MNSQELQRITKSAQRRSLWTPAESAVKTCVGRDGLERLLPHRDPFLLIDEVTDVDLTQQTIRGSRHIAPDDPVFRGHFPGRPVYPGVLQLEVMGQLGLCLLHFMTSGSATITNGTVPLNVRAVRVHFAQFLSPVGPGDDLSVVCKAIQFDEFTGICAGQILRQGAICSFGVSEVYFLDE